MATVILMASSNCFMQTETKAEPNNNRISGFLNCSKYFIHGGSSSFTENSLYLQIENCVVVVTLQIQCDLPSDLSSFCCFLPGESLPHVHSKPASNLFIVEIAGFTCREPHDGICYFLKERKQNHIAVISN